MTDAVHLEPHSEGTILAVQAQPRAKQNGIVGCHDGALKVQVTQAPEKGKANSALEKVLAKSLGLRNSQVRLLTGATSTRKRFLLTGIAVEDLRTKFEALLK